MSTIYQKFLLIESNQIPLTEIPYGDLKTNIINPITKKPYLGIVLEGCFADLSNSTANNNGRFYDVPLYLEFVKLLRKQIFTPKGVYGELEHPESYAVNFKNVSHKLIDIWYDEETKKVMGRLILLDTPNGKIAQEIIKSGGQLAISARAAGGEKQMPDGSKMATVKLLVTFDLVYHPGFTSAVLEFKELNESQKFMQEVSLNKTGFSTVVYEGDIKNISKKFKEYISLNESSKCFYEWLLTDLNESSKEEKEAMRKDIKILDKNKPTDEEKFQNKLKNAAKKDLLESQKQQFFEQINQSQQQLKKKNQGKSYYQGAAGFMTSDVYGTGII
jgi:hypothetical protein